MVYYKMYNKSSICKMDLFNKNMWHAFLILFSKTDDIKNEDIYTWYIRQN